MRTMRQRPIALSILLAASFSSPVAAGPPYVSDDAEPTDFRHFEIYLYSDGATNRAGTEGSFGIDFNYGATPDLQLTAVLPIEYSTPAEGAGAMGVGNIELAAKYRFLHQSDAGFDVAVFPRVFLASPSALVGDRNTSLLLPIWLERDWGQWTTFGGGGCVLQGGHDADNYCLFGWALARQVLPNLQIGAEFVHQGAPSRDERAMSGFGAGIKYDISEHYHLLAYTGSSIENAGETERMSWYSSVLFTF